MEPKSTATKGGNRLKLTIVMVGFSSVASAAEAGSIQYNWTGGEVTISAINNNNGNDFLAAGASLPLTAPSQVTFNSSAQTVPSFDFTDQGTASFALQGALAGDTLKVTDLTAVAGTPYSASATGTNPYTFTLGAVDVSGTYEVLNASNTLIVPSTAFSHDNPTLSGQITTSGTTMSNLTLNGITFGAATIHGTPITFEGAIVFSGAAPAPVPVPGAVWLFGSGLAGLAAFARRRRLSL